MARIDWDLTIDTIKAEKCILFLGPEIFASQQKEKLDEQLLSYLKLGDDPSVEIYQDGLFFFRERQKRTQTYLKIRRFFQEQDFVATNALFEKIARIPFHLIIKVTPDQNLASVYEKLNLPVATDFYWKKHAADTETVIPSAQMPLIYNMLGSVERPESLVLTHDDLYDYLESIFQAQSMSGQLKYHISNQAQSIIFLGIPFHKWYMQLLLRVLHLHKDEEFMRFAADQEISSEIKTLCKDQFKVNFVPKNIAGFIEEIYSRCQKEGLLKEPDQGKKSIVEILIHKLANDKLEEVLQQFKQFLESLKEAGTEIMDDVILLSSRSRRLSRKINQGILSTSEADLETNKIRASLLELLHEAKGFETAEPQNRKM